MRISERGQIPIPKRLSDCLGMNHDVEIEITPSEHSLPIQKPTAAKHPVERVSQMTHGRNTDNYIEAVRGR